MPQTILYTDEKENAKVMEYKVKWEISKAETIKRMIREFEEDDEKKCHKK